MALDWLIIGAVFALLLVAVCLFAHFIDTTLDYWRAYREYPDGKE